MPHYVFLASWTNEGIRQVKQSPERADAFRSAVEAAGGKVISMLHTMGAYDVVAAVELPSDDVANQLALRIGREGFVRTTTLKGWTPAEFRELTAHL
jgi:uncharacterized protein with GYD domain